MFTSTFYKNNRNHLIDRIQTDSTALFFSGWTIYRSGDSNYPFSADNNFYYLTGIREAEAILAVEKTAMGEGRCTLFILKADPEKETWFGKKVRIDQAAEISGISEIRYADEFESWFSQKKPSKIYLDSWMADVQKIQREKSFPYLKAFSQMDIAPIMQSMRNIKQPEEIEAIKQGIALTAKGIEAVQAVCHPGVYEYQLQSIFEYIISTAGAEGTAFPTIVASGINGPILHYETNRCPIKENTFVLLDLGAKIAGYSSDISRTLFCGSKPTDEQIDIYETVLEVQKKIISLFKPGKKMKEIQEASKNMLFEEVCRRKLLSDKMTIDDIYYHGIGHPLGLDTHDLGRQPELVLKPGMVLTCEPGLYFRDQGIGIRIEDDILITENGPVNLSEMIPKNMIICE